MQNQLDRQQRDDAERHRTTGQQHPEEVEEPGPDHREIRWQRMRIDHCGDGVGGVVETVDELEAQGNQQGHAQEYERRPSGHHGAKLVHVVHQAIGGEQQPEAQYCEKHHQSVRAGFFVQLRFDADGGRRGGGERGSGHAGHS
ncbi:hypothetical protein D3C76_906510 [compost metagenome]